MEPRWDISDYDAWNYDEIPLGAMALEGGTSTQNHTGGWRVKRPVWSPDKCVDCLMCWLNCPEDCIPASGGVMQGINYDFCKGCGICVVACKFDALHMVNEKDARTEEKKQQLISDAAEQGCPFAQMARDLPDAVDANLAHGEKMVAQKDSAPTSQAQAPRQSSATPRVSGAAQKPLQKPEKKPVSDGNSGDKDLLEEEKEQ